MPRHRAALLTTLACSLLLTAMQLAGKDLAEVRHIEQSFVPVASQAVRFDLSFGHIVVKGEQRDDIAVDIVLSCPTGRDQDRCRQRAERLVLEARNRQENLLIRLRRTPRARVHGIRSSMTILVPEDHHVEIDVRSGSVEISGTRGWINVDVGNGDTTIFYQQSLVGHVSGRVGIGSANLWLKDDSHIKGTGWPRSFAWQANGTGRVTAAAANGDIKIRLVE